MCSTAARQSPNTSLRPAAPRDRQSTPNPPLALSRASTCSTPPVTAITGRWPPRTALPPGPCIPAPLPTPARRPANSSRRRPLRPPPAARVGHYSDDTGRFPDHPHSSLRLPAEVRILFFQRFQLPLRRFLLGLPLGDLPLQDSH